MNMTISNLPANNLFYKSHSFRVRLGYFELIGPKPMKNIAMNMKCKKSIPCKIIHATIYWGSFKNILFLLLYACTCISISKCHMLTFFSEILTENTSVKLV